MRARMGWGSGISVLVLAITFAFAGAQGATATQDQNVIAGQVNTETKETVFSNTGISVTGCIQASFGGVAGCGDFGVEGRGTVRGVFGGSPFTGVEGSGGQIGVRGLGPTGVYGSGTTTGVYGFGNASGVEGVGISTGNGMWGHTDGGGSGIYGETSGTGYGVLGYAPTATAVRGQTTSGTGVLATASNSGTALKVTGKAQFSRSGKAVVQSGQSSVTISNVALSAKSLVLTTAQKSVAGVYVQAAVPDTTAKTITIYLNATVAASYPVAWFVVERS